MLRADDILAYFKERKLDEENRFYLRYHRYRYEFLLRKVAQILRENPSTPHNASPRILDIGPSFQTEILRSSLPNAIVNTLGLAESPSDSRTQAEHFMFDLNDAHYQEKWPKICKHDLVILAEVLEHLYTSPILVLKCISTWLRKGGALLIQTPNACSLYKRLKLLIGDNPFQMIRETRINPGHFREYTIQELIHVGTQAGFTLVQHATCNYFDESEHDTIKTKLCGYLSAVLPATFRAGITIWLKKV